MQPGTFTVEPHLAERWEALDDTTYVFHLRHGVKWHNKPPVNGRELVADDVKFTFERFLSEKGNADRHLLEAVDRIEVVDRYTVKFVLKEPYVWLVEVLATPRSMWIIAPEVVKQFGDLKKPESTIGTGPFLLERYEPNVKTVFTRNPDYFLKDQPYVDGVEWLVLEDESTGLAMYRTGQIDCRPVALVGGAPARSRGPQRKAIPSWCIRTSSPTSAARSTCARICRPSTTCGYGRRSPWPLIGRESLTAWGPGANRPRHRAWFDRVVRTH